jgi:hypothetical protein
LHLCQYSTHSHGQTRQWLDVLAEEGKAMSAGTHILFGVDVQERFIEWFATSFIPRFRATNPDANFAGFICDNVDPEQDEEGAELFCFTTSQEEDQTVTQALLLAAHGKARVPFGTSTGRNIGDIGTSVKNDDSVAVELAITIASVGLTPEAEMRVLDSLIDFYVIKCSSIMLEVTTLISWVECNREMQVAPLASLNKDPQMLDVYREVYAAAMAPWVQYE